MIGTNHGDESEVTLLLQICFDGGQTSTGGFANGLDQQTLANTQLDTHVVGTKLD